MIHGLVPTSPCGIDSTNSAGAFLLEFMNVQRDETVTDYHRRSCFNRDFYRVVDFVVLDDNDTNSDGKRLYHRNVDWEFVSAVGEKELIRFVTISTRSTGRRRQRRLCGLC